MRLGKCDMAPSAQMGSRSLTGEGSQGKKKKGMYRSNEDPQIRLAKPKLGDMSCTPKGMEANGRNRRTGFGSELSSR